MAENAWGVTNIRQCLLHKKRLDVIGSLQQTMMDLVIVNALMRLLLEWWLKLFVKTGAPS